VKWLWEFVDGSVGESYIRVYVWANSLAGATELAQKSFKHKRDLRHERLFASDDKSFVTERSDSGFDEILT